MARSGAASTAARMRSSKESGSLRDTDFGPSGRVAPGTRRDSGGSRLSSPMRFPLGRVRGDAVSGDSAAHDVPLFKPNDLLARSNRVTNGQRPDSGVV